MRVQGRDTLYFGSMSSFTIPWVASYHATIVQEMKVSFPGVFAL